MTPAHVIGWTWASYCIAGSLAFVWLAAFTPVELCPALC